LERIDILSVREIAKNLVAELELNPLECDPDAGRNFEKIAVLDYVTFLRQAPYRSPSTNQCTLETCYIYFEKAVKSGISEERMERIFSNLRAYWIPRLRSTNAE
jgi:hypothetical protein